MEPLSGSLIAPANASPITPTIIRAWSGGPLRYFSTIAFSNCVPYVTSKLKGYAGSYVCELCKKPVVGVYKGTDIWLCGSCVKFNKLSNASVTVPVNPVKIGPAPIVKPRPIPEDRPKRVYLIRQVKDGK